MRVLFFGTSAFALPTLQAIHDAAPRHQIAAIVTQPDRPQGRGLKLHPSPVKELALALGYSVLQPERVRRGTFFAQAEALRPDALVVISFGQIISQKLLDLPRWGGINVHASLLPRWRGAAPIHWAILTGDSETGVATMQMEATLDTGPTYLVAHEPIGARDTVGTLEPRLALAGGALLIQTLDRLEAGTITPTPQPEDGMTYASPVTRADGMLDPARQTAAEMDQRVRGTSPQPGATVALGGRVVRVVDAHLVEVAPARAIASIGVTKRGVEIAGADGQVLVITRLQPENKGVMAAADWARGARLTSEDHATVPVDLSKSAAS